MGGIHVYQDALRFLASSRSYLKGDMYKLILNLNHSDGAFALYPSNASLLSSKAQGQNIFENHLNPVMLVFIG